ncbi:MAG: hypothetical protein Q9216_005580 [Gyalolechia sp. 2 TL-2023]
MDPITATQLAASLSQLAKLAVQTVQYLNDIKDVSKDQATLLQEASNVLSLLISLRTRLQQSSSQEDWFLGIRSIGASGGPLDQLRNALNEINLAMSAKDVGYTLKWPLGKAKRKGMLDCIERAKSAISLALQNDTFKCQLLQVLHKDYTQHKKIDRVTPSLTGSLLSTSIGFSKTSSAGGIQFQCLADTPGTAGAGKSVLAAVVLDSLYESFGGDQNVGIAAIYLNRKERDTQSPENVVAAVWAQLLKRYDPINTEVKQLHSEHSNRGTKLSIKDVFPIVERQARTYQSVYIVVDALDETSDSHRTGILSQLNNLGPHVRIMTTSRHIQFDHPDLAASTRLEIRAHDEDLQTYITGRIDGAIRLSRLVPTAPGLKIEILSTVTSSSEGMFLVAKLHLDSIASKTTKKAVRKALDELPETLDDVYREALDRINQQSNDEKQLAERTLMWLTHAYRPFSPWMLQHALAVEPGESHLDPENIPDLDLLLGVCAGLVVFDQQSQIVRLVHYTAQQHFEQNKRFPTAHQQITLTCVGYLLYNEVQALTRSDLRKFLQRPSDDVHAFHLLPYAVSFWYLHAKDSPEDQVEGEIMQLLSRKSSKPQLGLTYPTDVDHSSHTVFHRYPTLCKATFFRLNQTINNLLLEAQDLDAIDKDGFSALRLAVRRGQHDTVKSLLDWGANVEERRAGHDGSTPLLEAISRGSHSITGLLLDAGADPDAADKFGLTPLQRAIQRDDIHVVKLLIKFGADPRISDSGGTISLEDASEWLQRKALNYLPRISNVNAHDSNIPTRRSLHRIIREHHIQWRIFEIEYESSLGCKSVSDAAVVTRRALEFSCGLWQRLLPTLAFAYQASEDQRSKFHMFLSFNGPRYQSLKKSLGDRIDSMLGVNIFNPFYPKVSPTLNSPTNQVLSLPRPPAHPTILYTLYHPTQSPDSDAKPPSASSSPPSPSSPCASAPQTTR